MGENTVGGSAVTILGPVSQEGVGLVDHDAHGAHGLENVEHFFKVALRGPLPAGPEVPEPDDGNTYFPGKTVYHEGFSRPHRSGDKVSHGQNVQAALFDRPGGAFKPLFHKIVARNQR